jgi:large subunit ribosomal protein L13
MNHKHKTPVFTREEAIKDKKYYLLDASGKTLGRFASEVVKILRGKHKPGYTPNVDTGDGVIIINSEKIDVSGAKEAQKVYRHHTGHIGGLKEIGFRDLRMKKPSEIVLHAIKGMMPRTKLGRHQLKKLHVFVGSEHHLQAQKPIVVNI